MTVETMLKRLTSVEQLEPHNHQPTPNTRLHRPYMNTLWLATNTTTCCQPQTLTHSCRRSFLVLV